MELIILKAAFFVSSEVLWDSEGGWGMCDANLEFPDIAKIRKL